ncbi:hypothetical protein GCM10020001_013970 [Nonomuraea salmonea]
MTWAFVDEGAFETVATAHGLYSAEVLDQLAVKVSAEVQADFTEWRHSHPEATPQQLEAEWQDVLEERMSRSGGAAFARAACDLSMTTWAITDAANISMISAAKEDDARLTFFSRIWRNRPWDSSQDLRERWPARWPRQLGTRCSDRSSRAMRKRLARTRTRLWERPSTCSPTSRQPP